MRTGNSEEIALVDWSDARNNPYAPPQAGGPSVVIAVDASAVDAVPLLIEVVGEDLLVPQGAVLPPLCVKTGVPIAVEDMRDHRLICHYGFRDPSRSVCDIRFGLSRQQARHYAIRQVLAVTGVGGFFLGACMLSVQPQVAAWGSFLVLFASFVCMLVLFRLPRVLRAASLDDGRFRITGCGPEFLAATSNLLRGLGP